ncbi:DegT/DnrJ/EryC1/StrS aminotransferase family protein [Halogranum rubrum]|uniref:DegT/DnrJ/EryC1/StrS aminotransferase family protein n=1 Tax=Halogranum rubrum TaxID=553466 RepID=A0A1I4GZ97_9EURY|nr:DegT/DnrJ/EryC1/StrS family aminotransferase [Halogranum rubrum]SFL34461.1 DegT/DnrJ/EryC1/StrS aminotransferase family protein [Halogranum rubrum]
MTLSLATSGSNRATSFVAGFARLFGGGESVEYGHSVTEVFADASPTADYCGAGKVIVRAILDSLGGNPGDNVVLPAAVPHGLVEPFRERGVEPRYHRMTQRFGADLDDLITRIDEDTIAVVLVHYFGFEQPDAAAIREIAADAGVPVVEDNSHAALSAPGGRLLGTTDAFGFTSLHKSLPVPNGAVVFSESTTALDDSSFGVADRPSLTDACFLTNWITNPSLQQSETTHEPRPEIARSNPASGDCEETTWPAPPTPYESMRAYAADDEPLSWLTAKLLSVLSAESIVHRRRDGYERWSATLDTAPMYDLTPGVCPWIFPVVVDDALQRAREVPDAFVWPRLPRDVTPDDFPVATDLARSVLALPVDRPNQIARLASAVE